MDDPRLGAPGEASQMARERGGIGRVHDHSTVGGGN
jgi:hypothetical protein